VDEPSSLPGIPARSPQDGPVSVIAEEKEYEEESVDHQAQGHVSETTSDTAESVLNTQHSHVQDTITTTQFEDVIVNQDFYGIRLTDTAEGRNSASMLVSKMYAWRGYAGTHHFDDDPNRITLTATDKGNAIGTLTLGIDSAIGLNADTVFGDELQAFRQQGARLCEFTKLAFDTSVRSKTSLGNLFHLAVIYARDIHHCTDIVIEVNPRHRRFYEQMLGFSRHSDIKTNPSVNAPAFLLKVSLAFITEQIQKYGGTGDGDHAARSFYAYFFSPREETGIVQRLLKVDERQEQAA
jgi:hypothetical protein